LETEEKHATITPVGHIAFARYEDRDDLNPNFVALADIQPDASYKYRKRVDSRTVTGNDVSGRTTQTEAGTFYLTTEYTWDDVACQFVQSVKSGGSTTYTKVTVDHSVPPVEIYNETRVWTASSAPGHEHEWLETKTVIQNGNTTVTTDYDGFGTVGRSFFTLAINRISFLFTYGHKLRTELNTYPEGTSSESSTLSGEWTEAELKALLEDCLDNSDWDENGSGNALYKTEYVKDNQQNPPVDTVAVDTLELKHVRNRLVIPDGFDPPPLPDGWEAGDAVLESYDQRWHGTWHNADILEIYTPEDHDPLDAGSPQPEESNEGLVWNGPGDVIDYDLFDSLTDQEKEGRRDSWKSDWLETLAPDEKGETEVDLKRSQCYHGAPWVYH